MGGPLVQFQAAKAVRDDTQQLLRTINRALAGRGLSENQIDTAFEKWWPDLENRLKAIPRGASKRHPRRSEREMLEETLELMRTVVRHGVLRREGDPIAWSQLLHVMEGGPRLLNEYKRQYLYPLKNGARPELAQILKKIEEEAAAIDAQWHSLISRSEALQRRIDLLSPRGQENLQQILMWMSERGTQEDLELLQHLRRAETSFSKETTELFEVSEREILKRRP